MQRRRFSTAKKKTGLLTSHRVRMVVFFVVVVLIVLAGLEFTDTTHLLHRQKTTSSTIPSSSPTNTPEKTNDSSDNNTQSNNTPKQDTTESSKSPAPSVNSGAPPVAPTGNFVSNHSPGRGGSDNSENSVCITTPGASCYITFTKNGVTKTLEAAVADSMGTVYWNWDVAKAGFDSGDWQIAAVATLNNQSSSTQDQIPLRIQ